MPETTDEHRDQAVREPPVALGWLDPIHILRSIILSLMDSADHLAERLMPRGNDEAASRRD